MSRIQELDDATEMMKTPTAISWNSLWWELRTIEGSRLLGRSTSRMTMERLQEDLRTHGCTEMESNI